MLSPRLLDHDEPVRVRVRGEDDEEPPEPDQLGRVRRERRVAAAHVEARDEHGPMCALSRHPARHRRHSIAYSLGTLHAIDAELQGRRARTGADQSARARRRTPRPARRCTVYNEAPSRARRTGSPFLSGRAAGRLRTSSFAPSVPLYAIDATRRHTQQRRGFLSNAGAAPWYTAT